MQNHNPRNPFTSGASSDPAPHGDVEREAVASLRGYAFQVADATAAWFDVPENGRVYLEVAEDYATVAEQTLQAVQVKDTAASGTVTLNTEGVQQPIVSYIDLSSKNPSHEVQLRYLTTSNVGTEKKLTDRPAGTDGLRYWRQAAAGASKDDGRAG